MNIKYKAENKSPFFVADFEDNSQSESLSRWAQFFFLRSATCHYNWFPGSNYSFSLLRVSKSAADEWPSSEDDDELVLIEKVGAIFFVLLSFP